MLVFHQDMHKMSRSAEDQGQGHLLFRPNEIEFVSILNAFVIDVLRGRYTFTERHSCLRTTFVQA